MNESTRAELEQLRKLHWELASQLNSLGRSIRELEKRLEQSAPAAEPPPLEITAMQPMPIPPVPVAAAPISEPPLIPKPPPPYFNDLARCSAAELSHPLRPSHRCSRKRKFHQRPSQSSPKRKTSHRRPRRPPWHRCA